MDWLGAVAGSAVATTPRRKILAQEPPMIASARLYDVALVNINTAEFPGKNLVTM
jgi:hypothetical protein